MESLLFNLCGAIVGGSIGLFIIVLICFIKYREETFESIHAIVLCIVAIISLSTAIFLIFSKGKIDNIVIQNEFIIDRDSDIYVDIKKEKSCIYKIKAFKTTEVERVK